MNHLVQKYVNKTGIKKVILTGGYGLNVVANNYLIRNNPDVEFYFEPNADDTGNSMGCAWYLYRNHTQDSNAYPKRDTWYHHIDPQDPVEGEFYSQGNCCDDRQRAIRGAVRWRS